jgi:hypothetical protein
VDPRGEAWLFKDDLVFVFSLHNAMAANCPEDI